jgi:hypothetical protein
MGNPQVMQVKKSRWSHNEERWHLWEMAKANLEKVHKQYKDFVDKF